MRPLPPQNAKNPAALRPPPKVKLNIEKMIFHLIDSDSNRDWHWQVEQLTASLGEKVELSLNAYQSNRKAIRISGELSLGDREVQGRFRSQDFPLKMLQSLLKRDDPNSELDGTLTGEWQLKQSGEKIELSGNGTGRNLLVRHASLQGDSLSLKECTVPCQLRIDGKRLQIDELSLVSDFGSISLNGSTSLDDRAMADADLQADLDIDLALLANRLPKMLHLQAKTELQSGKLSARLRTAREGSVTVLKGDAKTTQLKGKASGREVMWERPLSLDFVVKCPQEGIPQVEKLHIEADFASLNATTTDSQVSLEGRCNLDELKKRLSQFIDLGAFQVSGEGTIKVVAKRGEKDTFQLKGDATFEQARLLDPAGKNQQRDLVKFDLNVGGSWAERQQLKLTGGGFTIQAAGDGFGLYIVEPIPDASKFDKGSLRLLMRGQSERWQGRLAQWLAPLREFTTRGAMDVAALVKLDGEQWRLSDLSAKFGERLPGQEFQFVGYGINLLEPSLSITSSGSFRPASGKVTLDPTLITCDSLTAKFASIQLGEGIQTRGTLAADLTRLNRMLTPPGTSVTDTIRGRFSGNVELQIKEQITLQLDGGVENPLFGEPAKPLYRDTKVALAGKVQLDPKNDMIELSDFRLQGSGLGCTATGKFTELSNRQIVNLSGELRYDLEKLEPQLRSFLGSQTSIRGNETRPFKMEGSLRENSAVTLLNINGNAGLSWRELKAFGADIGATNVKVEMNRGWLTIPALETSLNQGKLKLQTRLRLEPAPSELIVDRGSSIERAMITPAMCSDAMGYIAPLLAKATEASGEFSIQFDGGRILLDNPQGGDIGGKLTLHSVKVGPGPLLKELSVLTNQAASYQLARDQVVPFRMVNGRIHHENLKLSFADLTLSTAGSVGLDGSLQLVAEMPIPPRWLGKTPLTPALAKQTIRLPIGGTINQPKIDEKTLRNYIAQFAKDATKDFLREEIEKGLQKLIPKK
jgi:hypothetical protein